MADRQYSEQYPEAWEINLKAIVDALQAHQSHGMDQSQQEASENHAANLGERQVLFQQLVSQQQQLFAQALENQAKLSDATAQYLMRVAHDGQSISVKELDPDVAELAEGAVMRDIVERIEALEARVK